MNNKATLIRTSGWITLGALLGGSLALWSQSEAPISVAPTAATTVAIPDAPVGPQAPAGSSAGLKKKAVEAPEVDQGPVSAKSVSQTSSLTEIAANEDGVPFVKRLVIARGVEDREPLPLTEGVAGESVTAFVELKHLAETDSEVLITFEHESGKKVGFIQLPVPKESPRYRTWGRTQNIQDAGEWTAVVTTRAGEELSRAQFTVQG